MQPRRAQPCHAVALTGRFPLYAVWLNRSDDRPTSERAWEDRNARPPYTPRLGVNVPAVPPRPSKLPRVTKFFWWPSEEWPAGREVWVDNEQLAEAMMKEGRPFGYRIDQGDEGVFFHSDEVYELDQRNIGCDIAAEKLRDVALNGPGGGTFGGGKMRAAAEAIAGLRARVATLECELARAQAIARPR